MALQALVTTERDTLGLNASTPQSLHVDVLDSCERALALSLAQMGGGAEAPRPPAAGTRLGRRGAPLTYAMVEASRANLRSLSDTSATSGAGGGGGGGGVSGCSCGGSLTTCGCAEEALLASLQPGGGGAK